MTDGNPSAQGRPGARQEPLAMLETLAHDAELADIFEDETAVVSPVPTGGAASEVVAESLTHRSATVLVSADRMTAFLNLPDAASLYTEEEVRESLAHGGVVHGVDGDKIALLLASDKPVNLAPVAHGTAAKPGVDAYVEYLFETSTGELQEAHGRVDWRALNLVHSVAAGQPIARKHAPQPGVPGINVKGEPTAPKPPKDLHLSLGPGTAIADSDPTLVVATVDGAVRVDADGRMTVDSTYVVAGDVDLSTGNVDFVGSVVIKGDVKKGFTIRATGDIEIKGVVEEAAVTAGGSFFAMGGVFGGVRPAIIKAGQDIVARYANNAQLRAGQDVLLDQEAINCDIEAQGKVIVGGKVPTKGLIRGGTVLAAKEIVAFSIGAVTGGSTKLRVGFDWLAPSKMEAVETELTHRQLQLEKAQERLRELLAAHTDGGLDTGQRMLLEKVRSAFDTLKAAVQLLQRRRDYWLRAAQTKGAIAIHGTAYADCELTVDGSTRLLRDNREGEKFVEESGKVIGLKLKAGG